MAVPVRRDEAAVSPLVGLVALVLVIAVALGIYYSLLPRPAPALYPQPGDTVLMNYIGTFTDTGATFDTSLLSVATDNASFPKAVSFPGQAIGPPWRSDWSLFTFEIGAGAVVPGFEAGVVVMQEGESRTIVVPPDEAYGPMDPTRLVVTSLTQPVPVRETMDRAAFRSRYGTFPTSGENVTDPVWGWPVTVSVAGEVVNVANSPVPGQAVRPYGAWNATVLSIDDAANGGTGVILVRHHLDSSMIDRVGAKVAAEPFYLWQVDADAETFTLNFNSQVVGRTLTFRLELVNILP